jgi:hypothetical protein
LELLIDAPVEAMGLAEGIMNVMADVGIAMLLPDGKDGKNVEQAVGVPISAY